MKELIILFSDLGEVISKTFQTTMELRYPGRFDIIMVDNITRYLETIENVLGIRKNDENVRKSFIDLLKGQKNSRIAYEAIYIYIVIKSIDQKCYPDGNLYYADPRIQRVVYSVPVSKVVENEYRPLNINGECGIIARILESKVKEKFFNSFKRGEGTLNNIDKALFGELKTEDEFKHYFESVEKQLVEQATYSKPIVKSQGISQPEDNSMTQPSVKPVSAQPTPKQKEIDTKSEGKEGKKETQHLPPKPTFNYKFAFHADEAFHTIINGNVIDIDCVEYVQYVKKGYLFILRIIYLLGGYAYYPQIAEISQVMGFKKRTTIYKSLNEMAEIEHLIEIDNISSRAKATIKRKGLRALLGKNTTSEKKEAENTTEVMPLSIFLGDALIYYYKKNQQYNFMFQPRWLPKMDEEEKNAPTIAHVFKTLLIKTPQETLNRKFTELPIVCKDEFEYNARFTTLREIFNHQEQLSYEYEKNGRYPKDILSRFVWSKVFPTSYKITSSKVVVELAFIGIKRSRERNMKLLKIIDNAFELLNYGKERSLIEYDIIFFVKNYDQEQSMRVDMVQAIKDYRSVATKIIEAERVNGFVSAMPDQENKYVDSKRRIERRDAIFRLNQFEFVNLNSARLIDRIDTNEPIHYTETITIIDKLKQKDA